MRKILFGAIAAAALTAVAGAETIATFADPSPSGASPVFSFVSGPPNTGSLSGGWATDGLNLLTPGLAAPDIANARFVMNPVAASGGPQVWTLAAGQIDFTDSVGNPLFTINFAGGTLTSPVGAGASDFAGNGVTFSGPIIPAGLTDEAFAFSFANPQGTLGDYTVTSAFTSSAVPEPASLILLAVGGLFAIRRR